MGLRALRASVCLVPRATLWCLLRLRPEAYRSHGEESRQLKTLRSIKGEPLDVPLRPCRKIKVVENSPLADE